MLFPQAIGRAEGFDPDSAEMPAPVNTTTLGFAIASGFIRPPVSKENLLTQTVTQPTFIATKRLNRCKRRDCIATSVINGSGEGRTAWRIPPASLRRALNARTPRPAEDKVNVAPALR